MSKKDKKIKPEIVQQGKKKSSPELVTTKVSTSFSGPLPPPHMLAEYERIQQGTADRIITMAEKQAAHRQMLENRVVKSNIRHEGIGMFFSFFLTLVLMFFGAYLISTGKEVGGYVAVFAPVLFHAGNYLYNRHREEKMDDNA